MTAGRSVVGCHAFEARVAVAKATLQVGLCDTLNLKTQTLQPTSKFRLIAWAWESRSHEVLPGSLQEGRDG